MVIAQKEIEELRSAAIGVVVTILHQREYSMPQSFKDVLNRLEEAVGKFDEVQHAKRGE